MRNKRKMIALLTSICTVFSCVPAYALDMDLSYSYKTESKDEFVIVGESHLNYNGEIPDYLRDIFDQPTGKCDNLCAALRAGQHIYAKPFRSDFRQPYGRRLGGKFIRRSNPKWRRQP